MKKIILLAMVPAMILASCENSRKAVVPAIDLNDFDTFGIKEGDPMWLPESERVHIW